MKIPSPARALAVVPLLALPLAARGGPEPNIPAAPQAPVTSAGLPVRIVPGEIMDVSNGSFLVRPYDPTLPKRVRVRIDGKTRILEQKKGKPADIRRGDMIAVLQDLEPEPAAPAPPEPSKKMPRPATPTPGGPVLPVAYLGPGGSSKNPAVDALPDEEGVLRPVGRAKAVIRMWEAPEIETTDADVRAANALVRSAEALLAPGDLKKRQEWFRAKTRTHVGVVTGLNPIVIQAEDRLRRFTLADKPAIVVDNSATPAALKEGKSVTVQSQVGILADESMDATLVALAPKPHLSGRQERRIILRDQGKKFKKTDMPD